MKPDIEEQIPKIFLMGPPGAGKSTLGAKACKELDLKFFDISTPSINDQSLQSQKEILEEVINKNAADIIALSWSIQQEKGMRTLLRRSGTLLLLWAHPLDMQTRSSCSEPLFTPSPRIKTRGGFGRNGTGCREFRSLDRTADEVLMLVGSNFDDAVENLREYIFSIREESTGTPISRAGLDDWVDEWHESYNISKKIANIIVDAMARYILHLRAEGKSPRALSGVYSDLQAAGMLVIGYDYPIRKKAPELLNLFSEPPWTLEFKRKFSDSPNLVARYKQNLNDFARFLKN